MNETEDERTQDLARVRQKIDVGLEQLDRGEGLDGEETFAQLLAELESESDS